MKTVRVSILLLIAALLAIMPMAPALAGPSQVAGLTLSVGDPATGATAMNATAGGSTIARVKVQAADAMAGIQFDLTFNKDVLQAAPETGCPYATDAPNFCVDNLTPTGTSNFSFAANPDNVNGVIHFALASSVAGHGTDYGIADIKFNVTGAAGTFSNLGLANVVASDATPVQISLGAGQIVAGRVDVTAPQAAHYIFNPTPIAPAGSLGQSQIVPVTLTVQDSNNAPIANSPVFLSIAAAWGTANVGATGLTATPQSFQSDANGHVAIEYHRPYIATPSGIDTIKAQNLATSPTLSAETSYNFAAPASCAQITLGPSPIAAKGSLAANQTVNVTVTCKNASAVAIPNAQVFLSFAQGAGGGTTQPALPSPSAPAVFTTDANGDFVVAYTTPGNLPATGADDITAQNSLASPTVINSTMYEFGQPAPAAHFGFDPFPIAQAASLAANQSVNVTLVAQDGSGNAVPNAQAYLSFTGAGSTTPTLTSTPMLFTADANGHIAIVYKTPGTLPASGMDVISAQDALSGQIRMTRTAYGYQAGPQYVFSLNPIAPKGSLAANQTVNLTLTVKDSGGNPVANGQAYLMFGGVGSTTPALSNIPSPFTADADGHIAIAYRTPSTLPTAGGDAISAFNSGPPSGPPTVVASTTYEFGSSPVSVARYRFSPYPIATATTLGADQAVDVTLIALDSNNAPVANAQVYLDLTGPGSATPALTASPALHTVGSDGKMIISFKTPANLAGVTGAAVLHAANAASGATVHGRTGYSYEAAPQYAWDLVPIAPATSLTAGQTVNLKLTLKKSDGSIDAGGKAWVALTGPGSAVPALSSAPVELIADGAGIVQVQFKAPDPLPASGRSVLVAVNSTSAPTSAAMTSYEYALPAPTGWYNFDKFPIAQAGNLQPNQQVNIVVTAYDSNGQPTPNVPVFLSFVQTAGGGSVFIGGSWPVPSTPQQFATDSDGKVFLAYHTPATMPNQGKDVIVAQDLLSNWTKSAKTAYGFAPENGYFFDPAPIANSASLQAGDGRTVILTVKTPAGTNAGGAQVYLSFKGLGTVSLAGGGGNIQGQPTLYTADGSGIIPLTYTAPNPLPANGGHDHLSAFNVPDAPTSVGGTWYDFVAQQPPPQGWIEINPFPIAPAASLAPDALVKVAVTVRGNDGQPVTNAPVFLSFIQTAGGGTADIFNGPALTSTPTQYTTDSDGEVKLVFRTPHSLPASGKDVIVAQDVAANPAKLAKSAYGYQKDLQLSFEPAPIAPPQSLNPGETRSITLTVKDGTGNPLPNGQAYLSFKGLGSVNTTAGGVAIPNQPTLFTADPSGIIALMYKAPNPLPANGGHDHLNASNMLDAPTIVGGTWYDFNPPPGGGQGWYNIGPFPIAPAGTLPANQPVDVVVTVFGGNGQPAPNAPAFLSFTGAGSAALAGGGPVLTSTPTQHNADGNGQIKIVFKTPLTLPPSGKDVIVAQNTISNPTMVAKTAYGYEKTLELFLNPMPIAPPQSLNPGETRSITLTVKDGTGNPLPNGQAYLSFKGLGSVNTTAGGVAIPNQPTLFTADPSGLLQLTYKAPNSLPVEGGHDHLSATNSNDGAPTVAAWTWYDFKTVAPPGWFSINPFPIAPSGSLPGDTLVNVTVAAHGKDGQPAPNTPVFVSFTGAGTANIANGGPALNSAPTQYYTDGAGLLQLVFKTPPGLPASGKDVIVAQDALTNPAKIAKSAYGYAIGQSYIFDLVPIAQVGTLQPGQATTVKMTVRDAQNNPVPSGTQVYLQFSGLGTATIVNAGIPASPTPFFTDAAGQITITHTTSNPLPANGGHDKLGARNELDAPTVAAGTWYDYGTTAGQIASLVFSPSPIAGAGTLAANQQVNVTLTARDGNNKIVTNTQVYLSFNGGGSTAPFLGPTPAPLFTNNNGDIVIVFTAPATLPGSGVSTITAQNVVSNPTLIQSVSYTYGQPAQVSQLAFVPSPIAATGTLGISQTVTVTVTAKDGAGAAIANAQVWLSFTPTTGGGTANILNGPTLGSTPQSFAANGSGQVTIVYHVPATLPSGGTDTITAQNASTSPTVTTQDTYTFGQQVAQASEIVLSPSPIATSGSLTANQQVTVTVTAKDGSGAAIANAKVWLSFIPATGGGSATVGATALTSSPVSFTANSSGVVSIVYAAPGTLPTSGTDAIKAQNAASSPSVTAETTYDYMRAIDELPMSPNPIAAAGQLTANQTVNVTVTAWDVNDSPIPSAQVWLSIDPATGRGGAAVGATSLTATPAAFSADANGHVTVVYTAPASLPATGVFKITAQNKSTSPTVTAWTSYDFQAPVATITVAKMEVPSGVVTLVPVTVKLDGTKVTNGLGAYSFQVCYDTTVIEVTGVIGGDAPFGDNPTKNITGGCARFNALQLDATGPTGEFTVANLQVNGLGAGGAQTDLTLSVTSLKDADGANIAPYATNNGAITIRQLVAVPGMALEQDATDKVAGVSIRIKQVEDKSGTVQNTKIGAFTAKLTYSPSCINVPVPTSGNGVRQRDMDIAAVNINNTTGVTLFNGTSTGGASGLVKLGLVPVRLVGSINDACDLTLEFTSIKDVNGENIGVKDSASIKMTFRRGDARADGAVDIADALFIRQFDVGLANRPACTETVTTSCINLVNAASVKQDGDADVVDISDALFIAQQDVGLRDEKFVRL